MKIPRKSDKLNSFVLTVLHAVIAHCLCVLIFIPRYAMAADLNDDFVAVVYPELHSPYSDVFDSIVEGMNASSSKLMFLQVKDNSPSVVTDFFAKKRPSAIIALGSSGFSQQSYFPPDIPIVLGAIKVLPRNRSGLSLNVDPSSVLALLQQLKRPINTLYVVYSKRQSRWWIDNITPLAAAVGIKVVGYEAEQLKDAMGYYQKIFRIADAPHSAIWLPLDSKTVNTKVVLPYVLTESWERRVAVLSSSAGHVRRGLLAALYPRHETIGEELVEIAREVKQSSAVVQRNITHVHYAINTRTAKHLNIEFSSAAMEKFDMVYPRAE